MSDEAQWPASQAEFGHIKVNQGLEIYDMRFTIYDMKAGAGRWAISGLPARQRRAERAVIKVNQGLENKKIIGGLFCRKPGQRGGIMMKFRGVRRRGLGGRSRVQAILN